LGYRALVAASISGFNTYQRSGWGLIPERGQLIFALYYDQELNLKEIALALDVPELRISQIKSGSVKKLRKKLIDWI